MTREKEVATLTISGVTKQMTGEYAIVATNSAGTTTHKATITICGKLDMFGCHSVSISRLFYVSYRIK